MIKLLKIHRFRCPSCSRPAMLAPRLRILAAFLGAAVALAAPTAHAQSPDQKPPDQGQKPPDKPADAGKDDKRKIDQYAEAAAAISGPAGNAECVWVGKNVVGRLLQNDLDMAFRHLELYDRFGCPGSHIQASFRCVVRQGDPASKPPETVNARIHACWINPGLAPATASVPTTGTSSQ
jgi:hypothetical protein